MGADEVGPCSRRQELHRGQRRRDALRTHGHSSGKYYTTVGHNVLISSVVRTRDPLQRGAFFEAKTGTFFASNAKVQLKVLDFVAVSFSKPAAFPGWVGECGEYLFRRGGIAALNDERSVD